MKKIRRPNLYSETEPESKFEALERTITDLIEAVEELQNPEQPTESPKPDWVKEEIAAAHDTSAEIKKEIGRIRGYLSRIDQFQGDEPTHAHMALSCLANVEIYLGRLTERPSDDLLWKAFRTGISASNEEWRNTFATPWEAFQTWLTTIPPDTLKEDRDAVAFQLQFAHASQVNRDIWVLELPMNSEDQGKNVLLALKRLCGMEVGG